MNLTRKIFAIGRLRLAVTFLLGFRYGSSQVAESASQIDIHGPIGSGRFGSTVTVLPNGNFLVSQILHQPAVQG